MRVYASLDIKSGATTAQLSSNQSLVKREASKARLLSRALPLAAPTFTVFSNPRTLVP